MDFRRKFEFGLAWRTILFVAAILLVIAAAQTPGIRAGLVVAALIAVGALASLWEFIRRTNFLVSRFVESVRFEDYSQRFSDPSGGGFDVLGRTLDHALASLQARHEAETAEVRYLSAIVDDAPSALLALDANGGSERWATLVLSLFSPVTSLAFDDESVFAADIAGGLYRLDAADGKRRWSYQLNEVVLRSSPVVSGSSLLLGLSDGRLVALDTASGHLVWQSAPSPGLVGTIALASDAVLAVKGGREAGLIAFEHDPDGELVDIPSPTELDAGTTVTRWTLAALIVFAIAFVPGMWANRRWGTAGWIQGDDDDLDRDPEREEAP